MGLAIARNWIIKPKQEDTKFSDAGHVAGLPAWLGFFSFNIGIEMSIFYRNLWKWLAASFGNMLGGTTFPVK